MKQLSTGQEGAKEPGILPIFPIYDQFNGEARSYLEFPNHLIGKKLLVRGVFERSDECVVLPGQRSREFNQQRIEIIKAGNKHARHSI